MSQSLYEKARRGALDRRFKVPEELSSALENHGVAGIFIDPSGVVLSSSKLRSTPIFTADQSARI